jgi:hypothetical protein
VLPWPDAPMPLHEMVYGPTGLLEFNTIDNFATVPVTQSLFFNGFD